MLDTKNSTTITMIRYYTSKLYTYLEKDFNTVYLNLPYLKFILSLNDTF